MQIPFSKVFPSGIEPSKAHEGDAGYDLFSDINLALHIGVVQPVITNIAVAIPKGYCGLILPRSSMGRRGIIIPNAPGLIDSGYRGQLKVLLLNLTKEPYRVHIGDRIAQLVIMKYEDADFIETEELPASYDKRGVGGFGSSGK